MQKMRIFLSARLALLAFCGLGLLCFASDLAAQEPAAPRDTIWVVEMLDGNTYSGNIVDTGGLHITMYTSVGVLTLERRSIRSMQLVARQHLVKGVFWPENPHSSRHFFSPSGYGLRKGQGYYQNIGLFFNQVSYGVTDNISIGGGIIPVFLFGAPFSPAWITPKISFPYRNDQGSFGVGTILGGVLGQGLEGFGVLYAVNTVGNRESQITVGIGMGYGTKSGFVERPTFNISGMRRLSRKWSFVTENYLFTTPDASFGVLSGGARFMGRRLAIDLGGLIPVSPDFPIFIIIPWLSLTVPFQG